MTREERNDAIEFFKKVAEKEVDNAKYSKLAIEALDQESSSDDENEIDFIQPKKKIVCKLTNGDVLLDKIKAEIEQTADEEQKHDRKWATGLRYAVKIIDKYKKKE